MKLVIITGITGKLGNEYLRYFANLEKFVCMGFSRRAPEAKYPNVIYRYFDLLDKKTSKEVISQIDLKNYEEVILIHPIGRFKFEFWGKGGDTNNDGIDDEIFASNVSTFLNIAEPLYQKIKINQIPLTLCAFGSITDRYNVPFWKSYTKSKNKLREIIKSYCKNSNVKGIFINVSTTDTGNERNLRPHADRTFWLAPKEIVNSSIKTILSRKNNWSEINIYKPNPNFNPTWYTNHENVLERWKKQMGLK
jgi:hypothetical protein